MLPQEKKLQGYEAGLLVRKPNGEVVDIPCRYRATAMDVATAHCEGVVKSPGCLTSLWRLAELKCWIQTGKLPCKVSVGLLAPRDDCPDVQFERLVNTMLAENGFIAGRDSKIVQVRSNAEDVVESLQLAAA